MVGTSFDKIFFCNKINTFFNHFTFYTMEKKNKPNNDTNKPRIVAPEELIKKLPKKPKDSKKCVCYKVCYENKKKIKMKIEMIWEEPKEAKKKKETAETKEISRHKIWTYESESKEIQFEQECPDEVIGTIEYDKAKGEFGEFKRRDYFEDFFVKHSDHDKFFRKRAEIKGRILIILESPHVDEFGVPDLKDYFSKKPVTARPAKGITGTNIKNHLAENLNQNITEIKKIMGEKIKASGAYSVSVINAVPYQCSLGFETKSYRDECFLKLWQQKKIREKLRRRIKNVNPDLIINAFTKGARCVKNKKSLQKLDLDFIKHITKKMIEPYNQNKYPLNHYYYDEKDLEKLETLKCLTLQNIVQHQIPDKYQEKTIHMTHPSSAQFKKKKERIKILYHDTAILFTEKINRMIKIKTKA